MQRRSNWDAIAIGFLSVVAGVVSMAFSGSIFNLFFVAIVVAVLWDYTNKVNFLERRIAELESKLPKEMSGASTPP